MIDDELLCGEPKFYRLIQRTAYVNGCEYELTEDDLCRPGVSIVMVWDNALSGKQAGIVYYESLGRRGYGILIAYPLGRKLLRTHDTCVIMRKTQSGVDVRAYGMGAIDGATT